MVKSPLSVTPEAPEDFPQTTPRDMYSTSDIRFVMLKLGELMTKVDGLNGSTEKNSNKLDELTHKVSFVKGAMWVFGILIAAISLVVGWYLSGKISITILPGS